MRGKQHAGPTTIVAIVENATRDGCTKSASAMSTDEGMRFWSYVARMDEALLLALRSGLVDCLEVEWSDPAGPYPEYPECWTDSWVRFWHGLGKDKPCT